MGRTPFPINNAIRGAIGLLGLCYLMLTVSALTCVFHHDFMLGGHQMAHGEHAGTDASAHGGAHASAHAKSNDNAASQAVSLCSCLDKLTQTGPVLVADGSVTAVPVMARVRPPIDRAARVPLNRLSAPRAPPFQHA